MVAIEGNTYAVREQLKELGGKWSPSKKCWLVPDAVADQARALVASRGSKSGRRPLTCGRCGCRINYGVYCGKCEYS